MQERPLLLSRQTPALRSMRYDELRETGLEYIRSLAGKVWTDHNAHDPGITLLEALCYGITDLGHRLSFDIRDILTPADGSDIKNFHSAASILPNRALTIKDYRKLLMDVKIPYAPSGEVERYYGIKNAWLERSYGSETPIWVQRKESQLSFAPANTNTDSPLYLEALWSVLLEFDASPDERIGDLNDKDLTGTYTFANLTETPELDGTSITFRVVFPAWDTTGIDWSNHDEIRLLVEEVEYEFENLPETYQLNLSKGEDNRFSVQAYKVSGLGLDPLSTVQEEELAGAINTYLYGTIAESLTSRHQEKIAVINQIVAAAQARLCANRNLCEDFRAPNALRVEEIVVCADIELYPEADPVEVQASIELAVAEFLAPQIPYYTLEEMLQLGIIDLQVEVVRIDAPGRKLTVDATLADLPEAGEQINLQDSQGLDGLYTIDAIFSNPLDSSFTDITLAQALPEAAAVGNARLQTPDRSGQPVEQIFEGPLPMHGFITDDDLSKSERLRRVHVSDLIRIIMNIAGVAAVRQIQIANLPFRLNGREIDSQSVRWCLDIYYEDNYVPRFNADRSSITYYRNNVPVLPSREAVESRIDTLSVSTEQHQPWYQQVDLPALVGTHLGLHDYTSLAYEFPTFYGVGEEGLAEQASPEEKQSAWHLSSYLSLFDQILANEMVQLDNVRNLFSMNAETDQDGEYIINSTYFEQSLRGVLPAANGVLAKDYESNLPGFTEDEETFASRRNRFLNHLLARFGENLGEYSLLLNKLQPGADGDKELIKDKLSFLNHYPAISSMRGLGIDYCDPCRFWLRENRSGVEQRVAALGGVDQRGGRHLWFGECVSISGSDSYTLSLNLAGNVILTAGQEQGGSFTPTTFETEEEARLYAEQLLLAGLYPEHYQLTEVSGDYQLSLWCGEQLMASSAPDYADEATAQADADSLRLACTTEFYDNPLANRKNLASPLDLFADFGTITTNGQNFDIAYTLYDSPAKTTILYAGTLDGTVRGERELSSSEVEDYARDNQLNLLWQLLSDLYQTDAAVVAPALQELKSFSDAQFFSNEGLHLIEHILLRPRQEAYYVPVTEADLNTAVAPYGSFRYHYTTTQITRTDSLTNMVELPQTLQGDLSMGMEVRLQNNAGERISASVTQITALSNGDLVQINLDQSLSIDFLSQRPLSLTYAIDMALSGVDPAQQALLSEDPRVMRMPKGSVLSVEGSDGGTIDRQFILAYADGPDEADSYQLYLKSVLDPAVQDDFLRVRLNQEACAGCELDDPYSYVASVILPYWPGNYLATDYRRFFEKSLRQEAPAHVFLNICWVSRDHIAQLEAALKGWLLELARPTRDVLALSAAQNTVLEQLALMRNVYPPGTLHDCDEDDTLENSIILNNSVIGNA